MAGADAVLTDMPHITPLTQQNVGLNCEVGALSTCGPAWLMSWGRGSAPQFNDRNSPLDPRMLSRVRRCRASAGTQDTPETGRGPRTPPLTPSPFPSQGLLKGRVSVKEHCWGEAAGALGAKPDVITAAGTWAKPRSLPAHPPTWLSGYDLRLISSALPCCKLFPAVRFCLCNG